MIGILINEPFIKHVKNLLCYGINTIIDSVGSENVVVIVIDTGKKVKRILGRDDIQYRSIQWKNGDDWKSYEENIYNTINDLDTIIIMCGKYFSKTHSNSSHSLIDTFERNLNNNNYVYSINFVSIRGLFQRYMISRCCYNKHLKMIYYALDPLECCYTDLFNCGVTTYCLNKDNKVAVPTYELSIYKNAIYEEKTVDFTFYGTAISDERSYLKDYEDDLVNVKNSDVSIIYNSKQMCPQDEYYKKLAKSKYTLIIPSYDITTFSHSRFIEAIAYKCVPLVLNTVDLTDYKNTFPDLYDIIVKKLLVNIDGIQTKLDSLDYNSIINELLNSKSIKNLQNIDYYKERWSEIINMA